MMVELNINSLQGLFLEKGDFFVPQNITDAISSCIKTEPEDIEKEITRLERLYSSYRNIDGPIELEYYNDVTVDAYTIKYLPRNTLIPKILLLSIAEHPVLRKIPKEIHILDLGSGTGGVVLGLLDIFQQQLFSDTKVKIVALDSSVTSIARQKKLIKKIEASNCEVYHFKVDLAEPEDYLKSMMHLAPYDYIITANLLTELKSSPIDDLLSNSYGSLSENGLILIAEAPRLYTCKLMVYLSKFLVELGLSCYYPCPIDFKCKKSVNEQCWVWFETKFKCPVINVADTEFEVTDRLVTTWAIYCNSQHSVYDFLKEGDPDLSWGVATPYGNEFSIEKKMDYEVCTNKGPKTVTHTREEAIFRDKRSVILRGAIIGFDLHSRAVKAWHPLW